MSLEERGLLDLSHQRWFHEKIEHEDRGQNETLSADCWLLATGFLCFVFPLYFIPSSNFNNFNILFFRIPPQSF